MTSQNKRIATYIMVALGGLLLGWLLFGTRASEEEHDHTEDVAGVTEYTCSMHPQIRQNEPGLCPICGMELIPVTKAVSKGEANPYVLEMTPEAVALANIQTTRLGTASASNELELAGTVQLNEQKVSSITAKFPGRIERLYVNFTGQQVQKGQRLASVYSPELITVQRELQEAAKSKDLLPELYEAAKTKLRLWGISNSQIQRIENSNNLITSFDIHASVSGVVTELFAAVGDYVNTGTVLATVANLSSVWVVLDAYEQDLAWLKEGAPVSFTVPSIPGKEFTAKVSFVTPVLDAGTRSVQVRAEVANPGNQLKPGMFVNASLKTPSAVKDNTLAVPRTAVLWTGKRSVVYTKVKDSERPAFEMREVTLGPQVGDAYLVQSGLSEGDEVVTNGVFTVDAAAQLTGNYSMMSAPVSKALAVPEAFQEQLTTLADRYFKIKNALVASDVAAARTAAGNFLQALNNVDMSLLDGNTHARWMKLLPALRLNAEAIQKNQDIEKQRIAFSPLSDLMIEAVELFGINKDVAYKQSRPMVFGDQGAFWLSEQKEIRNPYFGQSMLSCGDTEETYRQGQQQARDKTEAPAPVQSHVH